MLALADPATGGEKGWPPAPHLDATSLTDGGDPPTPAPAGGLTTDALELARDDGLANGSWNVGTALTATPANVGACGSASTSGEAGSSARNMPIPSPTPSSAPVIVLAGDGGASNLAPVATGVLTPERSSLGELPTSARGVALSLLCCGLLDLAPITIALRALGLSSAPL